MAPLLFPLDDEPAPPIAALVDEDDGDLRRKSYGDWWMGPLPPQLDIAPPHAEEEDPDAFVVDTPPPQVTCEDEQVAEEVPVERPLEPAAPDGPAMAIDIDVDDEDVAVADEDKTMVAKDPPPPPPLPLDGKLVDIDVLPPSLFNAASGGGWMVAEPPELPAPTVALAEDTF